MNPVVPGNPIGCVRSPSASLTSALLLLVSVGVSTSIGCSNPACSEEVTRRLREECALTLGNGGPCFMASLDQQIELSQDLCNINDPDLDSTCLLEEDCDAISMGACTNGGDEEQARDPDCSRACNETHQACIQPCQPQAFETCSECIQTCVEARISCVERC